MREKFKILILSLVVAFVIVPDALLPSDNNEVQATVAVSKHIAYEVTETYPPVEVIPETPQIIEMEEDIELLALVTMGEAENQSDNGKRLVIDTILNRRDSERFPDAIRDVIYQKSQFTCMWNGRIDRCVVTEDIRQLVREELKSRTNNDVMFFTAGGYGKYGTPMFQVGDHYFSSY